MFITRGEFPDVTLHMLVFKVLLNRNGTDMVLGSVCMWCSMESASLMYGRHPLDRFSSPSASAGVRDRVFCVGVFGELVLRTPSKRGRRVGGAGMSWLSFGGGRSTCLVDAGLAR